MNAVEIEEAVSALAAAPFDAGEFPYAFLEAFGNKATTIKRLRSGASNKSDIGGVLQTSNIHISTCATGKVTETLTQLRVSPAYGGGRGIRTLGTLARTTVFETAPFNHSGTPPRRSENKQKTRYHASFHGEVRSRELTGASDRR